MQLPTCLHAFEHHCISLRRVLCIHVCMHSNAIAYFRMLHAAYLQLIRACSARNPPIAKLHTRISLHATHLCMHQSMQHIYAIHLCMQHIHAAHPQCSVCSAYPCAPSRRCSPTSALLAMLHSANRSTPSIVCMQHIHAAYQPCSVCSAYPRAPSRCCSTPSALLALLLHAVRIVSAVAPRCPHC